MVYYAEVSQSLKLDLFQIWNKYGVTRDDLDFWTENSRKVFDANSPFGVF